MFEGLLTQYGLPGAALAVAAGLIYALIKRGLKVKIEAGIPPRQR